MRTDKPGAIAGGGDETERTWRRLWLRVALPIAGVILIAAGIVGATFYQYQRNRAGVLALSDDLVETLQGRVRREVSSFLRPAADGAAVLSAIMPAADWAGAGRETLEAVGMRLMGRHEQIGLMYVGRDNGDFLMLRRANDGAIDTKLILHRDGRRRTTWVRRDPTGNVDAVEPAPDDTYDPRTRSWYRGALSARGRYWSEVYVFFTDKAPGVTVAQPAAGSRRDAVVGVDLRLTALNAFLRDLEDTARARLAIVDGDGRVVAAPSANDLIREGSDGFEMPRVHDLDNPILAEAYDRMRIAADGTTVATIDGERHILAAASLAAVTDRQWRLLLVAREDRFAGFVATSNRRALVILGATLLLAAGMAGTLAYQATTADRRRRDLEKREIWRTRNLAVMDELVATAAMDPAADTIEARAVHPALMRDLAAASGADRAGIWRREGSQLVCETLYDAAARAYTEGSTIARHECPNFFAAFDAEIAAQDAANQAETRELATCYLTPAGMLGFLSIPILQAGEPIGFVWLETARETDLTSQAVRRLARLVAGLLVLRWQAMATPERVPAAATARAGGDTVQEDAPAGDVVPLVSHRPRAPMPAGDMRTASLAAERGRALRELLGNGADAAANASLYPNATVAVVHLLDEVALARAAQGAPKPTIASVIDTADQCARELDIPYIKLMGSRLIAVDGFDESQTEAAVTRMAAFALRFREASAAAFRALNDAPAFSIGLDTGPVMGSAVGFGQGLYNVWGEAVDVASSLAAEATAGRIQASAACYEHLRAHYLLRPMGTYFLERTGEIQTYDLRGEL